jgi:hypothetical protein
LFEYTSHLQCNFGRPRGACLIYVVCVRLRIVVVHTYCGVFVIVVCTLCVLPVSLDCLFWLPFRYNFGRPSVEWAGVLLARDPIAYILSLQITDPPSSELFTSTEMEDIYSCTCFCNVQAYRRDQLKFHNWKLDCCLTNFNIKTARTTALTNILWAHVLFT